MIIQKNNVVLFSNFQTKSFKIWCKNTGNKTVNLNTKKLRYKLETAEVRNLINNRKNFVEKLELRNGKWICFSSSLANEIC